YHAENGRAFAGRSGEHGGGSRGPRDQALAPVISTNPRWRPMRLVIHAYCDSRTCPGASRHTTAGCLPVGVTPKYGFSGILTGPYLFYPGNVARRNFIVLFPCRG